MLLFHSFMMYECCQAVGIIRNCGLCGFTGQKNEWGLVFPYVKFSIELSLATTARAQSDTQSEVPKTTSTSY